MAAKSCPGDHFWWGDQNFHDTPQSLISKNSSHPKKELAPTTEYLIINQDMTLGRAQEWGRSLNIDCHLATPFPVWRVHVMNNSDYHVSKKKEKKRKKVLVKKKVQGKFIINAVIKSMKVETS